MISRVEIKMKAKEQIKGNIWMLFLVAIIYAVICGAANLIPVVGAFVVVPPLSLGLIFIYLDVCAKKGVEVGRLFAGFQKMGDAIVLTLLITIFTFLWSLLFVIPGIIKGISYSQSYFILAENPDMTASEALNESKRIMDGHKWEYFVLQLSFLGWTILASLTFGILFIWLVPYMECTLVNYYHKLVGASLDGDVVVEG